MGWLATLRALLGLCASLTTYLHDRKLIAAGEAQAIARSLVDAQKLVAEARKARLQARRDFDSNDGVPNDKDPNLRD